MIHSRRSPKHARPTLLPSSRTLAIVAGFGVLAVAVVTGCAAAQRGAAAQHAARPAPARGTAGQPDAALFVRTALGAAGQAASGAPARGSISAPGRGRAGGILLGANRAPDSAPISALAASGIPTTALSAYRNAAAREAALRPACGLSWPLLAGIGRVESNHGRFAGAVLHADGVSTPRIIGIALNGHGTALIRDTDGGRLDGDPVYDHAVGPMQFIPSTWASWGVDANGDGVKDPFNVFDAAAAAADYLCAAGRDLTTSAGQVQAILSYNYSYDYVSMVMGLERVYAQQTGLSVPVLPTSPATPPKHGRPGHKPPLPPVDPGRPGGVSAPANPRVPVKPLPSKPAPTTASTSSAPASRSGSSSAPSSTAPTSSGSTGSDASPTCPTPSSSGSSSTASSASSSTSASSSPPACPSDKATSDKPLSDKTSTAPASSATSGTASP